MGETIVNRDYVTLEFHKQPKPKCNLTLTDNDYEKTAQERRLK